MRWSGKPSTHWPSDVLHLLADENVPKQIVDALRVQGHDVVWMHEEGPTTPDSQILPDAQTMGRVVLTFDKDFGDLVFRDRQRALGGVILLRPRLQGLGELTRFVLAVLRPDYEWTGYFSVVEDGRIRRIVLTD